MNLTGLPQTPRKDGVCHLPISNDLLRDYAQWPYPQSVLKVRLNGHYNSRLNGQRQSQAVFMASTLCGVLASTLTREPGSLRYGSLLTTF